MFRYLLKIRVNIPASSLMSTILLGTYPPTTDGFLLVEGRRGLTGSSVFLNPPVKCIIARGNGWLVMMKVAWTTGCWWWTKRRRRVTVAVYHKVVVTIETCLLPISGLPSRCLPHKDEENQRGKREDKGKKQKGQGWWSNQRSLREGQGKRKGNQPLGFSSLYKEGGIALMC